MKCDAATSRHEPVRRNSPRRTGSFHFQRGILLRRASTQLGDVAMP
jgi:hypothetical protein